MRYDPQSVTFRTKYETVAGVAQAGGSFSDYIKHWLNVGRRAGDNAKNLARRRLLLCSFGEFAIARLKVVGEAL
ncbi:MAG TPA: hypothetical protein VFR12_01805 [Pyrinomonadaceae bacterium]|nr:hypothetical protein [Pyrinomonadaceae bacterium]